MKKYILVIVCLSTCIVKAQYIEAAKTILNLTEKSKDELMAEELRKINRKLETANKESILNKLANLKQQEYLTQVESFLLKVDDYVKKGKEINEIYDKEEAILQKMKEVEKIYSQQFTRKNRNELNYTTGGILKQTGKLVDTATSIISDNNYRLSGEERRNYLKEILSEISKIEGILNEQIYVAKKYLMYIERGTYNEQMKTDFEKDLEEKQRILNNI